MKYRYSAEEARFLALLRQTRKDADLTQTALARRIEEEQTFISKVERGERRLDILELRHICRALGLTLDEFARRLELALVETEEKQ